VIAGAGEVGEVAAGPRRRIGALRRWARRRLGTTLWRFGGESRYGAWGLRRALVVVFLALAALFTLLVARGWSLAGQIPPWWARAGMLDDAVAGERAEGLERGVTAALYSPGIEGSAWTVELRNEDANAWLRERLPRWLANRGERWPRGVSTPRVVFGADGITLGVSVRSDALMGERIVGVRFRPMLGVDGSLRASGGRALIGRAELPGVGGSGGRWTSWLPEEWTKGEAGAWLIGALGGEGALIEESALTLDDGRRIRLVGIRVEADRVLLSCVNEGRGGARK